MQRLADLLDAPVDRPMIQETTALGAAYLAGLPPASIPSPQNSPTTGGWSIASSRAMSKATRSASLAGLGERR